jgi:hypothetical protein
VDAGPRLRSRPQSYRRHHRPLAPHQLHLIICPSTFATHVTLDVIPGKEAALLSPDMPANPISASAFQGTLEPQYPPPPRVSWGVLLLAEVVISSLISAFAPAPYRDLLNSLVVDAWAFYLCLWIRKLDVNATSPFWCDVYVIVELAFAAIQIRQQPSPGIQMLSGLLGLTASILGIVMIFVVRADLIRHYNQREDYSLVLSPVMTFFFSFLYFQYHLCDIADQKRKERKTIGA